MKCQINTRKELYQNVFIVGGTTMAQGFKERLESELNKISPPAINGNSPPRTTYS